MRLLHVYVMPACGSRICVLLDGPVTAQQGTLQHGTATYPMLDPILRSERENPKIPLESTKGHLLQRGTHTGVAVQTDPHNWMVQQLH